MYDVYTLLDWKVANFEDIRFLLVVACVEY